MKWSETILTPTQRLSTQQIITTKHLYFVKAILVLRKNTVEIAKYKSELPGKFKVWEDIRNGRHYKSTFDGHYINVRLYTGMQLRNLPRTQGGPCPDAVQFG